MKKGPMEYQMITKTYLPSYLCDSSDGSDGSDSSKSSDTSDSSASGECRDQTTFINFFLTKKISQKKTLLATQLFFNNYFEKKNVIKTLFN